MNNKKRNVEVIEFVSIIGLGGDMLQKLAQAVEAKGGNIDTMRRLISEPDLCDKIAYLLVGGLKQLVKACGFVFVHPDITEEHFGVTGPSAAIEEMFLVTEKDLGGSNMRIDEIEVALDRFGYRSVNIADMLVYAAVKWYGTGMVVALGSSWMDGPRRYVAYLCGASVGRKLNVGMMSPGSSLGERCQYLVVRK